MLVGEGRPFTFLAGRTGPEDEDGAGEGVAETVEVATPLEQPADEELDARGVPVVFTTGRPIRWMEELWADVGGHGLAICSNGALVYDVARREVRDFRAVPREVGVAIAEQLRSAVPGTHFAVEHTTGWASEVDFPHHPDDRAERHTGVPGQHCAAFAYRHVVTAGVNGAIR